MSEKHTEEHSGTLQKPSEATAYQVMLEDDIYKTYSQNRSYYSSHLPFIVFPGITGSLH